ncbi:polysaccharide pyruvyl transferase [Kineothrix alysoides]|uniref:Polysaccharide pyruvyl transferase n=1 Tax=Kineothrix alysoides TaxID=1469948 RepID=A0A4R1QYS3_9FIRM|nr:polysaccharide pyruvyl transferase [Kineothrix alysoides]
MKKIGILTFHYADNYGAVLQAYALRRVINVLPDCVAEIINFVPKEFTYSLYKNDIKSRQLLCGKRKKFEDFLQKTCGISSPMISKVEGNQYDYYCVGSDQVWNIMLGDVEFFLPHLDENAIRISYAASIGMSSEKVYEYKDLFEKHVSKFKEISLREQAHVDFIQTVCHKECQCVLDPTLLLKTEDYSAIITEDHVKNKPFILFFWLFHDDNLMKGIEFVNTLSRKYGLPIVHTVADAKSYMFNMDYGNVFYEGVDYFLWYIKNASFVVTNSYHATLFSMQFKTPFYTFLVDKMSSRMNTLSKKFGICDRMVNSYINPGKLDDNIDFGYIEERLIVERDKSIDFLKAALDVKI